MAVSLRPRPRGLACSHFCHVLLVKANPTASPLLNGQFVTSPCKEIEMGKGLWPYLQSTTETFCLFRGS